MSDTPQTETLQSLVARLDEASAWLEVHPAQHPVTRRVAEALAGMRAVIDSGSGPTESADMQSEVLAAAMPGEDEELADLVREIGALWRELIGSPGRRMRKRGTSQPPVFVITGGLPVRSVPMVDGGLDVLAFDVATGRLNRDMKHLEAVVAPGQHGCEVLDVTTFYAAVDALRRRLSLPAPAAPTPESAFGTMIDWLGTGDAARPYRAAVDGDEWVVQVNDWPSDPTVYTLIVNGAEAFDFDGWPDEWSRP